MKKFVSVLFTLAFIALGMTAQSFPADGIYYYLNENSGSLTVTYPPVGEPLYEGDVVIPETVEYDEIAYPVGAVGDYAFSGCPDLLSVSLPSSISAIGRNAFSSCPSLQEVNIPEGITEIPLYAFNGCESLQQIVIPSSVSSIAAFAFSRCQNLSSVSLDENIVAIGEGAFAQCSSLEAVTFPLGLQQLGEYAFRDCTSISEISFPESLTSVPDGVCYGCTSLSSVYFPETVTTIGESAFKSCIMLDEVSLPSMLTYIGKSAFELCIQLEKINFTSKDLEIGEYAFSGCSALFQVNLEGVSEIGAGAFMNVKNLSLLQLPENLKKINPQAFKNDSRISEIYSLAETPPYLEKTAFDNEIYQTATLYVVRGFGQLYRQSPPWSLFLNVEDTLADAGADSIQVPAVGVTVVGGSVIFTGLESPERYEVFSVFGSRIMEGVMSEGEAIDGLSRGAIYLVKIAGTVFKVAL